MSKTISRTIHGFANLLMAPMKVRRRWLARARTIEGFYQNVPISTDRGTLMFHITNRQTLTEPLGFEAYEPDTLEWIRAFPKDAVLWDIGANIGIFTLYSAQEPSVRILAFEPAAATYAVLIKNIEINGFSESVSAYSVALSDETKCGLLNMETTDSGAYLHVFEEKINVNDKAVDVKFQQSTVGISIDDFIHLFAPPLPTHVKIDVDGTESRIIEGGRELFSGNHVKSVFIEVMGDLGRQRNQRIIQQMTEFGYKVVPMASPEYRNLEFRKP